MSSPTRFREESCPRCGKMSHLNTRSGFCKKCTMRENDGRISELRSKMVELDGKPCPNCGKTYEMLVIW